MILDIKQNALYLMFFQVSRYLAFADVFKSTIRKITPLTSLKLIFVCFHNRQHLRDGYAERCMSGSERRDRKIADYVLSLISLATGKGWLNLSSVMDLYSR